MKKKAAVLAVLLAVLIAAGAGILFFQNRNGGEAEACYYQSVSPEDIVQEDGKMFAGSQLLLTASEGTSYRSIEQLAKSCGGEIVGYLSISGDYQIAFPDGKTPDELNVLLEELEAREEVAAAALNYAAYASSSGIDYAQDPWCDAQTDPNSVSWTGLSSDDSNWWAKAVELPEVWRMDLWDDSGAYEAVKVGVIDGAFAVSNKDLESVFVKTWQNDAGALSANIAHGTHVAGIIAAEAANGYGITGTASCAKPELYGFALNSAVEDHVYLTSLMEVKYAFAVLLSEGVRVINCSFGSDSFVYAASVGNQDAINDAAEWNEAFARFFKTCLNKGYDFLIVQGAGNTSGYKFVSSPDEPYGYKKAGSFSSSAESGYVRCNTRYDIISGIDDEEVRSHILVVGAADASSKLTYFSNEPADVYAPGENILSLAPTGLPVYMDGTSMAAPIVTGIAALVWSVNPELSSLQVADILVETRQKGSIYGNPEAGVVPLVDADHAVAAAIGMREMGEGTQSPSDDGLVMGLVYVSYFDYGDSVTVTQTWDETYTQARNDWLAGKSADYVKEKLEGFTVQIYDADGKLAAECETDAFGGFSVYLPEGDYVAQAEGDYAIEDRTETWHYLAEDIAFSVESGGAEYLDIAVRPDDSARMRAYLSVIEGYEDIYGQAGFRQDSSSYPIFWMEGVCYLGLLDFDQDGGEELVLSYPNGELDYYVEVWGYNGKEAVLLYRGTCLLGGDIGGRWIEFTTYQGRAYLLAGFMGGEYIYDYYTLNDGVFESVRKIEYRESYYGYTYRVDGKQADYESTVSEEHAWLQNSWYFYLVHSDRSEANSAILQVQAVRAEIEAAANGTEEEPAS